jgi:predicted MPP superfamily phosphohydrolase
MYKKLFKFFIVINLFGVYGYLYLRYNPDVSNVVFLLFSLPIGILFLLFCTTIIYDISSFGLSKTSLSSQRRDFFKKILDILSLSLAFGLSIRAVYEAKHIVLEDVTIKIDNLARSYSIVQISDVHIGGLIDQKFIKDIVNKINNLNPDIVVITGDLVDVSLKFAKPTLNELKGLKSTFGTYFVVGNHEYFHGVEDVIKEVNSIGIKTLENESIYIGNQGSGFNLIGVYDIMGHRVNHHEPDLNMATKNIENNSPNILLAHQPRFLNEIDETHNIDLILCGHTHGGQIYPFKVLVKFVQPYLAGLYRHSDKTQIYVSRGTGFWGPPMRLGSSSEITNINLIAN